MRWPRAKDAALSEAMEPLNPPLAPPDLDRPLSETLRDRPGSAGEARARELDARREEALRRTGLLDEPEEGDPEEGGSEAQFDRVTAQVCDLLGVPTALFTLVVGDRQIFRAARGFAKPVSSTPLAESLCRHVRDSGSDLVVSDLPRHPIAAITPGAIENGVGAYLGTPVYAPGRDDGLGEPIASLCAISPEPRVWTARDAAALHALADGITTRLALLRSVREARAERRRAEASEEQAQAVLQAVPSIVCISGADGSPTYVSSATKGILGIDPTRAVGAGWADLIHADDLSHARDIISGPISRGEPYEVELRFRHADGSWRTLLTHGRPFGTEGANRYVSTSTDVTSLRAAEKELHTERNRLQSLVGTIPHIVFTTTRERGIDFIGPQTRHLLGRTPSELMGFDLYAHLHPEDAETMREERERTLSEREPLERELRVRHADGRWVTLLARGFPLDETVDPDHAHVFTLTDVTTMREAERGLATERARLTSLVEAVPHLVVLTTIENGVDFLGPQVRSILGREPETMMGFGFYEYAHPEDKAVLLRERARLLASREPFQMELRMLHADGRYIPMLLRAHPIAGDADPRHTHVVTLTDVTAVRDAQGERDEERRRLEGVLGVLPTGLMIADEEGRIVLSNPEARARFGERFDVGFADAGWPRAFFLHAEEDERLMDRTSAPLLRAMAGESVRGEPTVRVEQMDGSVAFVKCDAEPLRDGDGRIVGAVMTVLDISDLQRARESADRERAASFNRLMRVIDSLPINVALADSEGRLLYANRAPLQALGLSVADIEGRLAWESPWIPDADTAAIVREEFLKAARGEISRRELSLRSGDGAAEADHTVVPILNADGEVEFLVPSSIDVTERNRALRGVDEERRRLRAVLDVLPGGLVIVDREMRVQEANASALAFLGSDPKDPETWPPSYRIEEDGRERLERREEGLLAEALRGDHLREPRSLRIALPTGDRFILGNAAPLYNSKGEIEGAVLKMTDVTELKRIQADLDEERRRLRTVLDVLPTGLVIVDASLRIIEANGAARAILNLPPDLTAMPAPDGWAPMFLIDADGRETQETRRSSLLARAVRGEHVRESRTIRVAHPRGDRFVLGNAEPLRSDDGSIEGAVMTITDVTDLRRAQEATTRERLRGAERLRETLDGLPFFVALLYPDGRILYGNRMCFEATDQSFEDVENVPLDRTPWFSYDERQRIRVRALLDEARQGGYAEGSLVGNAGADGMVDMDVTISAVYGDEGRGKIEGVRYLVWTATDVRERVQALRDAHEAREAAERATRAKDDFLAVLSHELRTPLTPAVLGLELMAADIETLEAGEIKTEIEENLAAVRSNLSLQTQLIDDLLDVTRIARGKLELRKRDTDLHDAARHAYGITRSRAEEKRVALDLDLRAERSTVHGDPTRLRQILWNLVANAVKFTPSGGHVRLETFNDGGGRIVARVVDDGPGIPADKIGGIFDAFDQGAVGVSRGFGGLGLGLAISRSLAQAHRATLSAASEGVGSGATFTLAMPVVGEVAPSEEPVSARPKRSRAGKRILLVEDNADTARLTADLLRRSGAAVRVCGSVAEAIAAGPAEAWDLILTDIGLPDGDGLDAVAGLRAQGIEAPAVAMSGYGREGDKARTTAAGFRTHLVKPVALDRLEEALDAALEGEPALDS